jgi:hypothetical protein
VVYEDPLFLKDVELIRETSEKEFMKQMAVFIDKVNSNKKQNEVLVDISSPQTQKSEEMSSSINKFGDEPL